MRPEDRPCVQVMLPGNTATRYTYWVHGDMPAEGDWVIVEAPRDEQGKLVESTGFPLCGQVVEINPPVEFRRRATKWIVQRIDWEAYRAVKALALNGGQDG